jgi:ribosomal protein L11 methyltransferase
MLKNIKIPDDGFLQKKELPAIISDVIAMIATSTAKMTPGALRSKLSDRYGLNKKQINTVIRNLVCSGELTYTYDLGHTFLELSFGKPVAISRHVVLTPPGHSYRPKPQDVIVQIKPGASFGVGNHPSTRLAIKAIEFVLLDNKFITHPEKSRVLDVGTGSGVLILTAVLSGMQGGIGIDIDSCARVEAAENVKINGLEDRIMISDRSLAGFDQRFSMVLANLRYPSLKRLNFQLTDVTECLGLLILSGIKKSEVDDLLKIYSKNYFRTLWRADELGWVGVVLQKIERGI